jgi:hypothetical protein
MNRLWGLKNDWSYKTRLEKIQQKVSVNPQSLIYQVRLGDFLAKHNRIKEAIVIYERTAQEFIRKRLFAQGIALKKVILRKGPARNADEQAFILNRLYEQMLESKTESQKRKVETLQEVSPSSQSQPAETLQTPKGVLRPEPNPTD